MGNKIIDSNYHKSPLLIIQASPCYTYQECLKLRDEMHVALRNEHGADYKGLLYVTDTGLAYMTGFDPDDLLPDADSWIWRRTAQLRQKGGKVLLVTADRQVFTMVTNAQTGAPSGMIRRGRLVHVPRHESDEEYINLDTGYKFKVVR